MHGYVISNKLNAKTSRRGGNRACGCSVFLKKCSCGYSAVDILCQNWGSIFPGNFDIKFTHALVFTRESVLKMRVFYVVSTVVLC